MKRAEKLLSNLNKAQIEAVTYEGGPLLILAGAGSGKTRVLTHRVAYFISKAKIKPQQALLLTFTNKAAGEMKERIGSITDGDVPYAGTFHSFSAKLLRIDGKYIGIPPNFIIFDETDQKDAVKQILQELNLPLESYNPSSVLNDISEAKNQMLTPIQYAEISSGKWGESIFKIYVG
ncbi:MAG: UvrD-helicase domain-containing protein, partial [Patescibacteria group bacterium]